MASAAYSGPTLPWKRVSATAGNSERGMASTIAAISTRNDITSTGRVPMKRSPSTITRRFGRGHRSVRWDVGQPGG